MQSDHSAHVPQEYKSVLYNRVIAEPWLWEEGYVILLIYDVHSRDMTIMWKAVLEWLVKNMKG